GDAEVLGLARIRIVGEGVTAEVVGPLFVFLRVALLGGKVNLAARPDIVARVNLRLGGEPGRGRADGLVHIDDHLHGLSLRIELDEIGVDAILRGPDIEPAVLALDDREIAALLVGVLRGNLVRMARQPTDGEQVTTETERTERREEDPEIETHTFAPVTA